MGLVQRELVRAERSTLPGQEMYRFRHLLIRDAAYEGMPKELRAELHERFADWLEEWQASGSTSSRRSSPTTSSRRWSSAVSSDRSGSARSRSHGAQRSTCAIPVTEREIEEICGGDATVRAGRGPAAQGRRNAPDLLYRGRPCHGRDRASKEVGRDLPASCGTGTGTRGLANRVAVPAHAVEHADVRRSPRRGHRPVPRGDPGSDRHLRVARRRAGAGTSLARNWQDRVDAMPVRGGDRSA